jgi:hypothetical protein
VEALAPQGEELVPAPLDVPVLAPPAVPEPAPMAVPALTAPLLAPDAAPLVEPELMTAIVPELVPLPVADAERPVRLPHPAMASSVNTSGDPRV